MFVLFDEAGKLQVGRILSEAEASAQIELDSGKRVKAKSAHLLLRFERPAGAELLKAAHDLADSIDLELAWECAPEDEFGFEDLACDYFSADASPTERAATLIRLHETPHYFRRAGKGRFKKAPAEIVQQALAALARKQAQLAQIQEWSNEIRAGRCPSSVASQLYRILFRPDKNTAEYKAVVEASRASHLPPLTLLRQAGAIDSAYQFHWKRFLFEHFPKGAEHPALTAPGVPQELPLASVSAYSIDDSATTEIDDALSLEGLGSGEVRLGIHIAAPGLALVPGSPIDQSARARLSTVYMPGHKLTMLSDDVVAAYTLQEGRDCPSVSLYLRISESDLTVLGSDTRIERVRIARNLRHDQLDPVLPQTWYTDPASPGVPDLELETLRPMLGFLHRFALRCKAQREVARGKPETFNRPDYSFRLEAVGADGPTGNETVHIGLRSRGSPLDLIVAEAMILANSTWGQWLASLGVPAIYRSQASLAPGVKVRMGAKALPHAGIGVPSYAWSTSPLRRYTDLVNQWQIIAAARHGQTAALAAPFKPRDAELFSIISAFDAAHTAYNAFQSSMERYWTLKHIEQQGIQELCATVTRDGWVRAEELPLTMMALGAEDLPRGARVRVRLGSVDELALDIGASVVERLGEGGAAEASDADLEDEAAAGPITIAVDLNEAEAESN